MRFRDLEYNLASRTLGTPKYKIAVKKFIATNIINYYDIVVTNVASLYLL